MTTNAWEAQQSIHDIDTWRKAVIRYRINRSRRASPEELHHALDQIIDKAVELDLTLPGDLIEDFEQQRKQRIQQES